MATSPADENTQADAGRQKPLDPHLEGMRRKLIRFMAINLGFLFIALMVVIAAIVYKSRTATPTSVPVAGDIPTPAGEPATGDIVLPPGTRIVSQSLSGTRLSIDAEMAGGNRMLFIYDLAERRMVGRFAIRDK